GRRAKRRASYTRSGSNPLVARSRPLVAHGEQFLIIGFVEPVGAIAGGDDLAESFRRLAADLVARLAGGDALLELGAHLVREAQRLLPGEALHALGQVLVERPDVVIDRRA